jgi:hypothetical protein
VPEAAHQDLVVGGQAGLLGERLGQAGLRPPELVVVEQEVVEDGELGVGGDLALADLAVEGAQAVVASRGVCFACWAVGLADV